MVKRVLTFPFYAVGFAVMLVTTFIRGVVYEFRRIDRLYRTGKQ